MAIGGACGLQGRTKPDCQDNLIKITNMLIKMKPVKLSERATEMAVMIMFLNLA